MRMELSTENCLYSLYPTSHRFAPLKKNVIRSARNMQVKNIWCFASVCNQQECGSLYALLKQHKAFGQAEVLLLHEYTKPINKRDTNEYHS